MNRVSIILGTCCLLFVAGLALGGFNLGMQKAVKQRVEKLDETVARAKSGDTSVTGWGRWLKLDGSNDRAQGTTTVFPNSSTLQSFTVEARVYPKSYKTMYIVTDDAYDLFVSYDAAASNNGLGVGFKLYGSGGSTSRIEYRDIKLNQWNHVVGIFDAASKEFKISINGILSSSPGTFAQSDFLVDSNYYVSVGDFFGGSSNAFAGYIDEVRISNNIRYTSNFTPSASKFTSDSNTRGLWHFDEPPGSTTFSDASSYDNTLTGYNGAQTE